MFKETSQINPPVCRKFRSAECYKSEEETVQRKEEPLLELDDSNGSPQWNSIAWTHEKGILSNRLHAQMSTKEGKGWAKKRESDALRRKCDMLTRREQFLARYHRYSCSYNGVCESRVLARGKSRMLFEPYPLINKTCTRTG